jgi:hypothetical protein
MFAFRGLVPPVARLGFAPLLDSKNVGRPAEIVPVLLLLQPTLLARRFAGLSACRFSAVFLIPGVAGVRREENVAVLALALPDSSCH